MPPRQFQLNSGNYTVLGHAKLASPASGFYKGTVVALDTVGGEPTVIKANGVKPAIGLLYDHGSLADVIHERLNLADPNSLDYMAGRYVGVVVGNFEASLSAEYFTAPPTINAPVYDNEDGLLTSTGTGKQQVGYVLGTNTSNETTVYRVLFHFGGALGVG